MVEKIGKPEWAKDERFVTNAVRVKNRDLLEAMIENETRKKTTQEWLEILEGCGMPYAAINDIQGTLSHEHGNGSQDSTDLRLVTDWTSWQCLHGTWLLK